MGIVTAFLHARNELLTLVLEFLLTLFEFALLLLELLLALTDALVTGRGGRKHGGVFHAGRSRVTASRKIHNGSIQHGGGTIH